MRLEASAPEDAEFYVVIRGSTLTHVTTAKRGPDGLTLRFTAPGTLTPDSICILALPLILPLFSILIFLGGGGASPAGHVLGEVAAVTSYCYAEERVQACRGEASLEYRGDVAQEVAECSSAAREQLCPGSSQEALKRFSTWKAGGEHAAGEVDVQPGSSAEAEKITDAVATLDFPQQWKNTDGLPREEGNETGSESVAHELRLCKVSFAKGRFCSRLSLLLMLSEKLILLNSQDHTFNSRIVPFKTKLVFEKM